MLIFPEGKTTIEFILIPGERNEFKSSTEEVVKKLENKLG